jgi:protoheme IX farnesyltransferase
MALRDWLVLIKIRIAALSGMMSAAGFLLAAGGTDHAALWTSVSGTVLTVVSASLFNMVLERDSDARMARTRHRPLPTGRISLRAALLAAGLSGAAGLAILFRTGTAAGLIALASLLAYSFLYTPLKRRSPWAFLAGVAPGAAPPLIG